MTETYTEVVTDVREITEVHTATEITLAEKDTTAGNEIIETEVGAGLGVGATAVRGEVLRPGVVIDDPTLLVEISGDDEVEVSGGGETDLVLDAGAIEVQVTKKNKEEEKEENCGEDSGRECDTPKKTLRKKEEEESQEGVIKTTKIDFEPERDELLAAVVASESKKRLRRPTSGQHGGVVVVDEDEMDERPKISSFRGPQKKKQDGGSGNVRIEVGIGVKFLSS